MFPGHAYFRTSKISQFISELPRDNSSFLVIKLILNLQVVGKVKKDKTTLSQAPKAGERGTSVPKQLL